MFDLIRIAKPYSQAIFELARESGNQSDWDQELKFLTSVINDHWIQQLINSPCFSGEQLKNLIIDIFGEEMKSHVLNFLRLLIRNSRVNILPEISKAYTELYLESEGIKIVKMITAKKMDEHHQNKFKEVLKNRLNCSVQVTFIVDKTLIGGAIIQSGDWIIDDSIQTKLKELFDVISAPSIRLSKIEEDNRCQ